MGTQTKHDIVGLIALLIMEDGGCNLTYVMTNANIKAAAKSPILLTHQIEMIVPPIKNHKQVSN